MKRSMNLGGSIVSKNILEEMGKLKWCVREKRNKDQFISAVKKFMEMKELTAPLLRELIDHIDVYETEGVGKKRRQRIVIHYRFVGYIEVPDSVFSSNYSAETRQGVAVEYVSKPIPA